MSYWPPQGGPSGPSAPSAPGAPGYQQPAPGAPPGYQQPGSGAPPGYQQQPGPGAPPGYQQPGPGAPPGYQQPGPGAPPGYQQPGPGGPPGYQQPGPGGPPGYQQPAYFQQQPPQNMYGSGAPFGAPRPAFGGPPPGIDPHVFEWFRAVDADQSGRISCMELQQALVNGNWRHFNPETCRLMISMFDRDGSGQIELHEFQALWNYIQQWRGVFERYDRDRSGHIEAHELQQAWGDMGYRLSINFTQVVVMRFDKFERRGLTLDNFIQASVMLKSLTDAFRQKDLKQNGQITVSFEDFLTMVLLHK